MPRTKGKFLVDIEQLKRLGNDGYLQVIWITILSWVSASPDPIFIEDIRQHLGFTKSKIMERINFLKKLGWISLKNTVGGTIVTVLNYNESEVLGG